MVGLIGNFDEFHQVIIDWSHSPQVNEQHNLSSTDWGMRTPSPDRFWCLADSPQHRVMAHHARWVGDPATDDQHPQSGVVVKGVEATWQYRLRPEDNRAQKWLVSKFPILGNLQHMAYCKPYLQGLSCINRTNQWWIEDGHAAALMQETPPRIDLNALNILAEAPFRGMQQGLHKSGKIRWGNSSYRYADTHIKYIGNIWDVITKSKDLHTFATFLSCFLPNKSWLFAPSRNTSGQWIGGFPFDSLLGASFASGTYGAARLWKAPCQRWNEDSCQLGYLR